jgi:hypothetical protein
VCAPLRVGCPAGLISHSVQSASEILRRLHPARFVLAQWTRVGTCLVTHVRWSQAEAACFAVTWGPFTGWDLCRMVRRWRGPRLLMPKAPASDWAMALHAHHNAQREGTLKAKYHPLQRTDTSQCWVTQRSDCPIVSDQLVPGTSGLVWGRFPAHVASLQRFVTAVRGWCYRETAQEQDAYMHPSPWHMQSVLQHSRLPRRWGWAGESIERLTGWAYHSGEWLG